MRLSTIGKRLVVGVATLATVATSFALTAAAASAAPAAAPRVAAVAVSQTPRLTNMVALAIAQTKKGIPYLYGGGHGAHPAPLGSRVDCSGFVREMYYAAFGVDIGGGSGDSMVRTSGKFVKTAAPVPGDVALFGDNGEAPAYHAGIYIGNVNGHPAVAAAPETGEDIKIQQWYKSSRPGDLMGYWHYKGATAADSGSATRPSVQGVVNAITGGAQSVAVSGWSFDPINASKSNNVTVSVDNHAVAVVPATRGYASVDRVYRITGNHGFAVNVPATAGSHRVCVVGDSYAAGGASAKQLACQTVTVKAKAVGHLDAIKGGTNLIRAGGWVVDPAHSADAARYTVSVDGKILLTAVTTVARPDVNKALHVSGTHGFNVPLAATPGKHTVCVTAVGVATSTTVSTALGCRAVIVTK